MAIEPGLYEMKTTFGLYRVTSVEDGMVHFTSLNGTESHIKSEEQFAVEYAEFSEPTEQVSEPESETTEMVEPEPDAGETVEVKTGKEAEV